MTLKNRNFDKKPGMRSMSDCSIRRAAEPNPLQIAELNLSGQG
jgi:hypothetical protein